jgi:hypothetical protein
MRALSGGARFLKNPRNLKNDVFPFGSNPSKGILVLTIACLTAQVSATTNTPDLARAVFPAGQQAACPVRAHRALEATAHDVSRGLSATVDDGVVIRNGPIKLGVTSFGALNVRNPGDSHYEIVGLRYIFPDGTEGDSTSYGCTCEGWGAGADGWPVFFNTAGGSSSYQSQVFSSTPSTAITSVVSSDGRLKVTHDFHPSATENLYEVTVTLENIGTTTINEPRYRRTMDWDIHPTPFSECVTIQPDPSTVEFLESADSNGFQTSNPYNFWPWVSAPFTDLGPSDHGANFNFKFDPIPPSESFSFNIYYGAGANQEEAMDAIISVAAEMYSFGKPRNANGNCMGDPHVFIFVSRLRCFSSIILHSYHIVLDDNRVLSPRQSERHLQV